MCKHNNIGSPRRCRIVQSLLDIRNLDNHVHWQDEMKRDCSEESNGVATFQDNDAGVPAKSPKSALYRKQVVEPSIDVQFILYHEAFIHY